MEHVTVRVLRAPHALLHDRDRDHGGAVHGEIRFEEHGGQMIERLAIEVADGAELPSAGTRGDATRLDLETRAGRVSRIVSES